MAMIASHPYPQIRTRVAPSPTGDPHLGTAYIALFNYCFARQADGCFILRIEDTDAARSTLASERQILDSLRWLGLNWDEGPDIGGACAPYRQSERAELYRHYAAQLVEAGHAFYCFASAEELDEMRAAQRAAGQTPHYDGRGLQLSHEEVSRRLAAGDPHVVRMKVPQQGYLQFHDYLRGELEIGFDSIDMQVLLKQDGLPTYFLANVVDDHLMGITHVFRGEEWLSSTPKLLLLYQYLGWQPPVFGHMPLLRNPDRSKLSKRNSATSILYYQRMGYLPQALLNYLARMGWSMPSGQEKFSLQEMIDQFDMMRVSLSAPIFDTAKLDWLNGLWLRESTSDEVIIDWFKQHLGDEQRFRQLLPHLKARVAKLSDAIPLLCFIYSGLLPLQASGFDQLHLDRQQLRQTLQCILWALAGLRDWDKAAIFDHLKAVARVLGVKPNAVMPIVFIAIAGTTTTFSITDAMAILGPELSRARLRHALTVLGQPDEDELTAWRQQFDERWRIENSG